MQSERILPLATTAILSVSRAVRMFIEEIEQGGSGIVTHLTQTITEYAPQEDDGDLELDEFLHAGWAIRPAHGMGFGHRYLTGEYLAMVEQLFWAGEKGGKGHKCSAHQMHELILKHEAFASRFDTPSVQEITAAIGVLCQNKAQVVRRAQTGSSTVSE